MRIKGVCLIAAICCGGFLSAVAAGAAADVNFDSIIGKLRADVKTLEAASSKRQAAALDKLLDALTAQHESDSTVRKTTLDDLRGEGEKFLRMETMWKPTDAARADALGKSGRRIIAAADALAPLAVAGKAADDSSGDGQRDGGQSRANGKPGEGMVVSLVVGPIEDVQPDEKLKSLMSDSMDGMSEQAAVRREKYYWHLQKLRMAIVVKIGSEQPRRYQGEQEIRLFVTRAKHMYTDMPVVFDIDSGISWDNAAWIMNIFGKSGMSGPFSISGLDIATIPGSAAAVQDANATLPAVPVGPLPADLAGE